MQTNQSRARPSLSDLCSSALIIPGPGARKLGTILTAQSLLRLFKLASPNLFTCSTLACPNSSKGSGLNLPFPPVLCLLSTLVLPHMALHAVPPASRTEEYNKFCFFLSFSCFLLQPNLNDHLKSIQEAQQFPLSLRKEKIKEHNLFMINCVREHSYNILIKKSLKKRKVSSSNSLLVFSIQTLGLLHLRRKGTEWR